MECYFCGCKVSTVEEAINAGWVPSWFAGDDYETNEPCCAQCCDNHLEVAEDGELVRVTD